MRDRRRNPQYIGRDPLTVTWIWAWLAMLVLALSLWAFDVGAYEDYGRGSYPGWHADMESHQRRRNEMLEDQFRYERRQDRRREFRENQEYLQEQRKRRWREGW